jgi:hypothetical protein
MRVKEHSSILKQWPAAMQIQRQEERIKFDGKTGVRQQADSN